MKRIETLGQLLAAIQQRDLEGLNYGYYFLEAWVKHYIEADNERDNPHLLCNRQENEDYHEALDRTPLPDDMWLYLAYCVGDFLRHTPSFVHDPEYPEMARTLYLFNQRTGEDIQQFLERYFEAEAIGVAIT